MNLCDVLQPKRKSMFGKKSLDCTPCAVPAPEVKVGDILELKTAGAIGISNCMFVTGNQEKAKNMYKDERTEAQQAKDYLIKSLEQALWNKQNALPAEYGLEQKFPQTVGELRKAEKDGWLTLNIPNDAKDEHRVYSWLDYIRFADPKVKPDEVGYHAAKKLLSKEASDVKDAIVVLGPEKGLEALNAFKAMTF